MRRRRTLSHQETLWVEQAIDGLCDCHGVPSRLREDCRSAAWIAFLPVFYQFYPLSSPEFWPCAYERMGAAILDEKRADQSWSYRCRSLDAPVIPGGQSSLLHCFSARRESLTQTVCCRDFLNSLPAPLLRLARCRLDGCTPGETRDILGLTQAEYTRGLGQLRGAFRRYYGW